MLLQHHSIKSTDMDINLQAQIHQTKLTEIAISSIKIRYGYSWIQRDTSSTFFFFSPSLSMKLKAS